MDAKFRVFQRLFGVACMCFGFILAVLPFTGVMAKDGPAYDAAMICLGMFIAFMGLWCIERTRFEVLQELLDTPIREPVLLRLRGENRHLIGIICIDRRTGRKFAPEQAEERMLEWVDLCNISQHVLRAPYFSEHPLSHSVFMLNADYDYEVPPKS